MSVFLIARAGFAKRPLCAFCGTGERVSISNALILKRVASSGSSIQTFPRQPENDAECHQSGKPNNR
jgi:hypothetical protein